MIIRLWALVAAVLIVCTTIVCPARHTENKVIKTFLCGEDFVDSYRYLCGTKTGRPRRLKKPRFKKIQGRHFEDAMQHRYTMHLLDPHTANQFLNTLRRRRRRFKDGSGSFGLQDSIFTLAARDMGMDNANEECCLEGCNSEEILEYEC